MKLPSKYIEKAVDEMSSLPGIGRKTALRLVLNMMNWKKEDIHRFSQSFIDMNTHLQFCKTCYNISDSDTCDICLNPKRDHSLICVVRDIRDVMAIENTHQYKGVYHILGGVISPIEGIGPSDLRVEELMERMGENISEVILGFGATMEGDTTNFYLFRKLEQYNVTLSVLSRGVSIGDELEYADETTLGRSILNRLPFESTM